MSDARESHPDPETPRAAERARPLPDDVLPDDALDAVSGGSDGGRAEWGAAGGRDSEWAQHGGGSCGCCA